MSTTFTGLSPSQPGSSKENDGSSPIQRNRIIEKRELHDLNTRLEMYVRSQSERERNLNTTKAQLAKQEIEFRERLKMQESTFERLNSELRRESERLQCRINEISVELETCLRERTELSHSLEISESRSNEIQSRSDSLVQELTMVKSELDSLRNQYGSVKYKYDHFDAERQRLNDQNAILKDKNKTILNELTKVSSEHRSQQDTFSRLLRENRVETDTLTSRVGELEQDKADLQSRLRDEFEAKLQQYIVKREEQYKQEKDEWMRIFKEEFNRKMRTFKETNIELTNTNKKQEEELCDIRSRLAQSKKSRSEMEVMMRNLEKEIESARSDIDNLRHIKDDELKTKQTIIGELRERYRKKESEFDELIGIKIQLSQEIQLFRKILSDAEKTAGYTSPIASTRKKRRLNGGESACYETPGYARAAAYARVQFDNSTQLGSVDDEMKDCSNDNSRIDHEGDDETSTPGEAYPLQFSTMDLSESMIEIQNISDSNVSLSGYSITNRDGSRVFELPYNKILAPMERVRVIVGEDLECLSGEINWECDVWCGDDEDVARLFDPSNNEIARIEIHPDMLPEKVKTSKCILM